MTPQQIAFLREIGTPERALEILGAVDVEATITGEILEDYLQAAYAAGRRSVRNHFVWYSLEELIPRA